jgi:hypothetical protein
MGSNNYDGNYELEFRFDIDRDIFRDEYHVISVFEELGSIGDLYCHDNYHEQEHFHIQYTVDKASKDVFFRKLDDIVNTHDSITNLKVMVCDLIRFSDCE